VGRGNKSCPWSNKEDLDEAIRLLKLERPKFQMPRERERNITISQELPMGSFTTKKEEKGKGNRKIWFKAGL